METPTFAEVNPAESHPLVLFAKESKKIGTLREVIANFMFARRGELPSDNKECAAVLAATARVFLGDEPEKNKYQKAII